MVSFGLEDEEHFACSLKASRQPTPIENFQAPERDLQYAADIMVKHHGQLQSKRRHAARIFQELGSRWQAFTNHLRARQVPEDSASLPIGIWRLWDY